MQLLTSASSDWVAIDDDTPDGDRGPLTSRLRQLLGAERLVILTGLGTSMSVVDENGDHPAPSMADLWKRAQDGVDDEEWAAARKSAGWSDDFEDDIELFLSRCQMGHTLTDDQSLSTFIERCEKQIATACNFVTADTPLPHHETFLRRVARRSTRLPRTQLFTTNYDLAFEAAASRGDFTLIDGFSHAGQPSFSGAAFDIDLAVRDRERAASAVEWVPNVLHLFKLHGSLDWHLEGRRVVRAPRPDRPLIIYPRSTKFEVSYQQPFLEMMGRFQTALRRPDTALIIVGSGLADRHVREPILAAIRSNVRLSALIVSPNLADSDEEHVRLFKEYINAGDRRLTLLAARFDEFVRTLPDLIPVSEAEQHEARVTAS